MLPKKYAKMGFAAGWRAYKKTKTKTAKTAGGVNMAKRRKGLKRYSRSNGGSSVMKLALGGAVYGVVREPINKFSKNIPMIGGFGDEVVLGIISAIAATKGTGWVRTIGRAGVIVEAHNLARNMSGGLLSGLMGSSSTPSTVTGAESFK